MSAGMGLISELWPLYLTLMYGAAIYIEDLLWLLDQQMRSCINGYRTRQPNVVRLAFHRSVIHGLLQGLLLLATQYVQL